MAIIAYIQLDAIPLWARCFFVNLDTHSSNAKSILFIAQPCKHVLLLHAMHADHSFVMSCTPNLEFGKLKTLAASSCETLLEELLGLIGPGAQVFCCLLVLVLRIAVAG